MSANSINSISEFLLHAGTEYHVFDLGRRLEPTDSQTFLEIENCIDLTLSSLFYDRAPSKSDLIVTICLPYYCTLKEMLPHRV